MGISRHFVSTLFISLALFFSSCSKVGETAGVEIPEDNAIDEFLNETFYYPYRDFMCENNFRETDCPVEETNTTTTDEVVDENTNEEDTITNDTVDNETPTEEETEKLRDIVSSWFDELSTDQQLIVQKDKNKIYDEDKSPVLTPVNETTKNEINIQKDTTVVLPYYIFDDNLENLLVNADSSNRNVIRPLFLDAGPFRIIDSNSIAFLELTAYGEINQTAKITVEAQEEDTTNFDRSELLAKIVDQNDTTYSPVGVYFTYDTIYIEEGDRRRVYFGISYTIDSNVTVVVRSDWRRIFDEGGKVLDLTEFNETNGVVNPIISNDSGVPSSFILDALGQKGEEIELFLVAVDGKGEYDYAKFIVKIVGVGEAEYDDNLIDGEDTTSSSTRLTGNDYDKLTDEQQQLVNQDLNNIISTATDRPIITIFKPSGIIRIKQNQVLNISFYVLDETDAEIYTFVYDEPTKVDARINGTDKFDVTYSNKYFIPLRLEALGEVGDIATITIQSEHANDAVNLYDRESFQVEIVPDDGDATYIKPELHLGFNRLFIEEGGTRSGLQFGTSNSEEIGEPEVYVDNKAVAIFAGWNDEEFTRFTVKATGRAGTQTTLHITITDGINSDDVSIPVTIVPAGSLDDYLEKEGLSEDEYESGLGDTNDENTDDTTDNEDINNSTETGDTTDENTDNTTDNEDVNNSTETGDTTDNEDVNNSTETGDTTDNEDVNNSTETGDTTDNDETNTTETEDDNTSVEEDNSGETNNAGDDNAPPTPDTDGDTTASCEDGYELQGGICQEINGTDVAPVTCPDGQILKDGVCKATSSRDLTTIAYDDWTDEEKEDESMVICNALLADPTYLTLRAPTTLAVGYSDPTNSLILKNQNATTTLTMIYRQKFTIDESPYKYLDNTYKVPQMRIDYAQEYAGATYYVIDEGEGICYINTFPKAGAIPFGYIEYVVPTWAVIE
ncbi:hypothetical protein ThvES_00004980 [Thiovulum sp. ES]|nr:hypothetical protein ThvES_00004980 [Thiovulum sp. ES]